MGGGDDNFAVLDPSGIPKDVLLEVDGGEGNDTIRGRAEGGREQLDGGPGDDTILTGAPADDKELDGGGGDDTIIITSKLEVLASLRAAKLPKVAGATLLGGRGDDRMLGGPQGDLL